MLTHSRLNDELKDTMGSSLRKHSVTIRIEEQTPRLPLQPLSNRLSGASVNDAFFQVRHVTILVSGGSMRGLTVEPVENWIYIEKLIDTLTHKMPHLTSRSLPVLQRTLRGPPENSHMASSLLPRPHRFLASRWPNGQKVTGCSVKRVGTVSGL
jgi:hypothetical protein